VKKLKPDKLNYRISGEGKSAILFLHGWGGSMSSFEFFENNLSQYQLVINLDLYGFGKSEIDYNNLCDIYTYALNIYLFLKENKIENINIVAHSFGGRIAILLASCFDIKINKMVLTGCAGIKTKKNILTKCKILYYKIIKQIKNTFHINFININKFGSFDYKQLSTDGKQFFNKILSQDLTYSLKYINCECILFWGKKDKSTSIKTLKIIKNKLKKSKLIIYKNSGHFCYMENKISFLNLLYNL